MLIWLLCFLAKESLVELRLIWAALIPKSGAAKIKEEAALLPKSSAVKIKEEGKGTERGPRRGGKGRKGKGKGCRCDPIVL